MQSVPGFEKSKIELLIAGNATFEIVGLRGQFMDAIKFVERTIEATGMRCRVETDFKSTMVASGAAGVALSAAAAPVVITAGVLGVAAGIGHKLVTRKPDYLIKKDYVNFKLTVSYKK